MNGTTIQPRSKYLTFKFNSTSLYEVNRLKGLPMMTYLVMNSKPCLSGRGVYLEGYMELKKHVVPSTIERRVVDVYGANRHIIWRKRTMSSDDHIQAIKKGTSVYESGTPSKSSRPPPRVAKPCAISKSEAAAERAAFKTLMSWGPCFKPNNLKKE